MVERFDEIFGEVMEELDADWWEVFDSPLFDMVDFRIAKEFGEDIFESEEYLAWYNGMAEDL